jgi:hypothetical protein
MAFSGNTATYPIENGGRASVSMLPGLYGSYQQNLGNHWSVGAGMGLKDKSTTFFLHDEHYGLKADMYGSKAFWVIKNSDLREVAIVGFLGGLYVDNDGIHPQFGLISELSLQQYLTLRINAVFGPRGGLELAYKYTKKLNLTAGLAGMSGIFGIEYNL